MCRVCRTAIALTCPAAMLAVLLLAPTGESAAPAVPDEDARFLREQRVPTNSPGLLDFLRKQTAQAVSEDRIRAMVEQLGDDSFAVREDATRALIRLGPRARRFLQAALTHTDLEVKCRARRCLAELNKDDGQGTRVNAAVVRLLARRRPAGCVAALLDYLPAVEDESVASEVREALSGLAIHDGKPDPVLVAALKDPLPPRRAAAAVALCRAGSTEHRSAVRRLLADPDRRVRLPVALALLAAREKEAVPVLIALMEEPPSRESALAEDLLFRLAGEKSPVLKAADAEARRQYRRAWDAWWKANGGRIDLAALEHNARVLGHTTVLLLDAGRVVDLDASNRVRWSIDGLRRPLDVQRLPGERVLLAEYDRNRVTERTSKGEVLREWKVLQPLMAQRLANGNTFIANQDEAVEIDPAGKEVFRHIRPNGEHIVRAQKLPGGDVVLIAGLGVTRFIRIDRFGRQVASFGVEVSTYGGRLDVTAAGTVLIPELHNNRVQERTMDGRVVRTLSVQGPITAVALPTGHVLVTSMSQNRAVEFDRAGREVWEYRSDTRVTRAVRP